MTDDQRRRIVAGLNGRTRVEAIEAAKAIWEDSDPGFERPLICTLKEGRRPFNRAAAAYAMQMVATPKTVVALERAVSNKLENADVRGHAAEALAYRHRAKSHDVLLAALEDDREDVRFWCAFALAHMEEKRALPSLKRIVATDKRIVKGWYSVAKEAADAIATIEKGSKWRRRKGRCGFCIDD
jgi:HEAT repeat protein